jgi:cell division protein FtsB
MPSNAKSGTAVPPAGRLSRFFFQARTGWRKALTVSAALLVLAVAYHVVFGQNGLTSYQQKRHDATTLDSQLKSLKHENGLLKGHVDRLQNDPGAIEHQAREELHYTRPGEVIYTLPASSPSASKAPAKN